MKLLLIEDSERLRRSLSQGLVKMGHNVDSAENGELGLSLARNFDYHAIILDLMLPKLDGLTILKRLRCAGSETSIIILSAKDQVHDRVKGLELGADDYLVKPFAFEELCARLNSVCRRNYKLKDPVISIDSVKIDTASKSVSYENTPVKLTPSEYNILECLLLQKGRVLSKNQLIDSLYEYHNTVTSNVIEVVVGSIRRKLKAAGAGNIIKTRHGFGYTIP